MIILITGGSGFIGTNLVDYLSGKGHEHIINLDKKKPLKESHNKYWVDANIMDEENLVMILENHRPDIIIHLAARTDTLSDQLEDYKENHEGTRHLLNAIKTYGSLDRLIVTSTQYVFKSDQNPIPDGSTHFIPHTVYGKSKVLTEQITHDAALKCVWTIIRPTNIWGPWHMRYPNELWKMIDQGYYFHPGHRPVIRTYGYVGNVVHQIYQMLLADKHVVNGKTFYVGDRSVDSYEWLNQISYSLGKKSIKRIPTAIFQIASKIGDVLRAIKIPFPLYSMRFKNMIEDYPAPTEPTIELFGQAEVDMRKNIDKTVLWLEGEGKDYFDHWNIRN